MRILHFVLVTVLIANLSSCTGATGVKTLKADEFEKAINTPGIQLVDVRTPEEYTEKHIANSTNINVDGSDFEQQMGQLDKSKPLYLYCLSGGRSNSAAKWAVKNGFKEVYNLDGGIMAWNSAQKPLETGSGQPANPGMSYDDYLQKIKSDKLVLVDFNAVWCGPCKMLKPIVDKVEQQHADVLQVLPIDVDKNPSVANTMNVTGIPLLILYKDGKEVWRNMGLTDERSINAQVKKYAKK